LKASRDSAVPILSYSSLKEWTNGQARKISECNFLDNDTKLDIACLIRALGGDTQNLPICKHNKTWVSYNELTQILKTRKVPIYLLSDYFVRNIEDNFKDTFKIYDNVIETDSSSYPILHSNYSANDDQIWPPRLKYATSRYESLIGAIIQAISQAWDIEQGKIADYFKNNEDRYQEVIIGEINGKEIYEILNVIDPNDESFKL
jgi:hypothetical protein